MSGFPRITVRDVLGPGGLAAVALEGFDPREAQVEMAEAIYDRLADGGVLAVEAPTGVGKTLAYLVPAILSGRRTIVSTNTKTLQDQILDKDLPLLARVLSVAGISLVPAGDEAPREPGEVRYALMKGRANYLCLDRLDRKRSQLRLAFDGEPDGAPSGASELERIARWSETTTTGDRAELTLPERSTTWPELDARAEICTGTRCPRYDDCFVVKMRRRAQEADLVIVNHHLLLADLSLRAEAMMTREGRAFGEVIPAGEVLILDEAHALEEIASEYFGGRISSRKLEALARDVITWLTEEAGPLARGSIDHDLTRAVTLTGAVFDQLPRGDGRVRIAADDRSTLLEGARAKLPDATAALTHLAQSIELAGEGSVLSEALGRRARHLAESVRFVLDAGDADYVYWTERQGGAVALGASPIHVANLLARHLFELFGAVVMTSATLATGDSGCGYFLETVGAPADTTELVLGSPFDYPRQAALYLPRDAPEPDAHDASHRLSRIGHELIELVGGGALFLFTSYRVMRQVHADLGPRLGFPVFVQGERPQRDLLRAFVDEAPAVLFATASFWEGVDIPGDPLRLVLIDRLPFGSPGDPLVAARAERLEAEGKSAFNRYHLPRAILRLKQGFGRLVRGKGDRGVVAILDRRVQTRGYGPRFLRALPPATRVTDPHHLARWLRDGPVAPEDEGWPGDWV
ncbi:ATP-dependent DNA helicase [Myxococcota bacterium]|nr:ATP-dependent DNA helicase [Myxococcota bacterium]